VDLICVINVSASMNGKKLDLVKKSLRYVLSKLNARDRISIIKFVTKAQVICNLTSAA
jgi:Mg-chelatase subunit ChlD